MPPEQSSVLQKNSSQCFSFVIFLKIIYLFRARASAHEQTQAGEGGQAEERESQADSTLRVEPDPAFDLRTEIIMI